MKTRLLPLAFLVLFLPVSLFARNHIVDNAGLLSGQEIAELEMMAEEIAAAYNFDLVIVTENDIGNASPMDYADDFFDYNGYGRGEDRDGCLFLQVTGSRDYWFSTSGRGIQLLNSAAFNKLDSGVVRYLREDNPAGAYRTFINTWKQFLVIGAEDKHYNFFQEQNSILVIIAWVLSFLIGLITVQVWKKQMNTAILKKEADSYMVSGSLIFTQKTDRFLYSTVTRTAKPKPPTSSYSGGSHTSSSGRSHGGGGGRY